MPDRITSTANPRIKDLARLKEARARRSSGRFLVEGHRELRRAHDAGIPIEEVVLAPELAGDRETHLAASLAEAGIALVEVGRAAFEKLSVRRHPDGVLGVARAAAPGLDEVRLPTAALVLVLDGIEKPGNLGAIVRSADAAGADLVVVTDESVEPTNPHAIRASQGAVFSVPVVAATAVVTLAWANDRGLDVVVASPDAADPLWAADLTGPVALVVGAEADGVGPVFRSAAHTVAIPMEGLGDSLNASVTAGILLYEAVRQRA